MYIKLKWIFCFLFISLVSNFWHQDHPFLPILNWYVEYNLLFEVQAGSALPSLYFKFLGPFPMFNIMDFLVSSSSLCYHLLVYVFWGESIVCVAKSN